MLLVAIDTSGRHGSVALCRAEQNSFQPLEQQLLEGGTYSARLTFVITDLLARRNVHKREVDAFVVVSGPGSFTGLRVGLATVKGLCDVLHKPLVAVSMMESVAMLRLSGEARTVVALDAGRNEVYVGEFEISGQGVTLVREHIAKLFAFAEEALSGDSVVLTPDSKVADSLSAAGAKVRHVDPLQASEIGRLGYMKLLAGEVCDTPTIDANYIRRSDAEIFSAPK